MRLSFKLPALALAVGLTALAAAAPGHAQSVNPEDIPPMPVEEVTEGHIASFVNAYIALEKMRMQYVERIEAAETQDEREALVAEADIAGQEMVDGMTGITANEYVAIAKAMSGSEELQERMAARIEELKQKRQPKGFSLPTQSE